MARAREIAVFFVKQLQAALFGILLLAAIIFTTFVWPEGAPLTRYDALVIYAVLCQVVLIATRLETWDEALVIALFHVTGTVMEIFKTAQGSWSYPEESLLRVGGVPLFTGFMYAAVGSYIARSLRLYHVRVTGYPPFWVTVAVALLIYGNFFAHHFLPDIRAILFAATILLFWRARLRFRVTGTGPQRGVRLPVAALLAALLVWAAENIGTFTRTWTYAGQGQFDLVSLGKLGSWYLLLYVSFVTVTLVSREALYDEAAQPRQSYRPDGV